MSDRRAITIGWLWVNAPTLVIMLGPLAALLVRYYGEARVPAVLFSVVLGTSVVASSLWWLLMGPRWRLWSYARVENALALKHKAAVAQLTAPEGSCLRSFEIKSAKHTARERSYEDRAYAKFGAYRSAPRRAQSNVDYVKAVYFCALPVGLLLAATMASDRFSEDGMSAEDNAALILFGTAYLVLPHLQRRMGPELARWHRALPWASSVVGLLCLGVVDYTTAGYAIKVAMVPLCLTVIGRALIVFLARR